MTGLQKSLYEELGRKFDNHSVFKVSLRGLTKIRLKSHDEVYLNREVEKAICYSWCSLHTDYRDSFINKTAIVVEQCCVHPGDQDEKWTCLFILRIQEPFHGLLIFKCLEHAGENRGIGEETPYYHYGRFSIQSMEPIDGNGDS